MDKRLINIYAFIKANRKYNKIIQRKDYKASLLPYDNTYDKVYALLYNILNYQSQLKMNSAAMFFRTITTKKSNLGTFKSFLKTLGATNKTPLTYKSLFTLLKNQPSWGDKTAALFVKAVYNTHAGYAKELKFWDDIPTTLSKADEIFLPVDAVIIHIFQELIIENCKANFGSINHYIKTAMPNSNCEVWDDLWYWGYITQRVEKKVRSTVFNEEKYWNLLHSEKDKNTIIEIKELANEFIVILKSKR